jgi:hypothetical protein
LNVDLVEKSTGSIRRLASVPGKILVAGASVGRVEIPCDESADARAVLAALEEAAPTKPDEIAMLAADQPDRVRTRWFPKEVLAQSCSDGALVLFLARRFGNVVTGQETRSQVVLASAISLAMVPRLIEFAIDHLSTLVRGEQLSMLDNDDHVLVDPSSVPRDSIAHRHSLTRELRNSRKKLLEARWEVKERDSIVDAFAFWMSWVEGRFGVHGAQSPESIAALRTVYSQPGFSAREFWVEGRCALHAIVFKERASKLFAHVTSAWAEELAEYSPGVYAIGHNLLEAKDEGLRFSLCFPSVPYKWKMLRGIPRCSP